ncbi:DUF4339 domain-containing protein [Dyella sp.]|uniref:DUF4339 domain-containing protein n=1 Tax=Dyella sp. TaxID=1869338 RepID=UPI002ED14F78
MTEAIWHYQNGNLPAGPVSAAEIRQKIRDGYIRRETLLWKEGMAEWAAASDTEFGPDTETALHNPFAVTAASTQPEQDVILPVTPVSAAPAWTMALIPLILIPLAYVNFNFVGLALYISTSIWDRNQIKASGRKPSMAFLWPILLGGLGAPIYLFLRANRTDRQWAYAIVSIVTIIVFFVAIMARFGVF